MENTSTSSLLSPTIGFIVGALTLACSMPVLAQTRENQFDDQTIVVRFREEPSEIDEYVVTTLARGEISWRSRYARGLCLVRLSGRDPLAALERLSLYDAIAYAEHNPIGEPDTALCQNPPTTNDTLFPSQWGLENTGQTFTGPNGQPYVGTPGADVRAVCAWTITQGEDQVVAVIDGGLTASINGPEYSGQVWTNTAEINGIPGIDDDGNGHKDDYYGWNVNQDSNELFDGAHFHGTEVGGAIVAKRNNSTGVSGVAPKAKEMVLRITGAPFVDPLPNAGHVVKAIEYAAQKEVKIINLSYSFYDYSQALYDICEAMIEKDMVIVCSAGNIGQNLNNYQGVGFVPASFGGVLENVIAVAGITPKDIICTVQENGYSSGYGTEVVLVAAPGAWVWTTHTDDSNGQPTYNLVGGTSLAAPHVAGIVAMIQATHPTWTPAQVRQRIKDTARNVPALSNYVISGGVIDAYECVKP